MNYFTQQSIQLAHQRDYLDQLFSVYPLSPDGIREIDSDVWHSIEYSYNNHDNIGLFEALLKLKLFPIKDGYVPYFRRDKSAISRNPKTVNRICGRVRELGLDRLYEKCTQPIWEFKDPTNPMYPTEKNLEMLKFIVEASSVPNSIVMDCFCGSGTTLQAADLCNRRWIGVDNSDVAIKTVFKRLVKHDLFSETDRKFEYFEL